MKKMGRPRQGKQRKINATVRVEPRIKASLIAAHGSLQKFWEYAVKEWNSKVAKLYVSDYEPKL